ncbi:GreA/GreB family elongation factor [Patescibacteria group bacterium]|nr:GreA/GreB family elongation factor [Patescibacteria group bacterium]
MTKEKKFYLTKEGLEKIKKEHKELKSLRSLKVKGEFPKILHSENVSPEYLSLQEDLSFIERRIAELESVLKNSELIKSPPKERQDVVNLGAMVLVQIDDQIDEFTIVGSLEANPSLGKISNESPVGKALLGHRVRDEVIIPSPIKITYKILKIKY